jgi:4-hydroxy-4-methyl-2-oxoglutarate aldolase
MPAPVITFAMIREHLGSALLSDALDSVGRLHQVPNFTLRPITGFRKLVGRARTSLWADMFHVDPRPYELELRAVDDCGPDDVLVAAAGGSNRSGIWGELLSTAAAARGCVGAIVDGMVRDVDKMAAMGFNVFAGGVNCRDSRDRQRVVDLDVTVEIGGVAIHPGDLVLIDVDGMVVVPQDVERETLERAWNKLHAENETRDAIRAGMKATEAWEKFGVL